MAFTTHTTSCSYQYYCILFLVTNTEVICMGIAWIFTPCAILIRSESSSINMIAWPPLVATWCFEVVIVTILLDTLGRKEIFIIDLYQCMGVRWVLSPHGVICTCTACFLKCEFDVCMCTCVHECSKLCIYSGTILKVQLACNHDFRDTMLGLWRKGHYWYVLPYGSAATMLLYTLHAVWWLLHVDV